MKFATMRLTTTVAVAILAFTANAAPAAIPPPALSSANLARPIRGYPLSSENGSIRPADPALIPLAVAPDGIIAPAPLELDTTTTGLPFDNHPANLEYLPYGHSVDPDTASAGVSFHSRPRHLESLRHRNQNSTSTKLLCPRTSCHPVGHVKSCPKNRTKVVWFGKEHCVPSWLVSQKDVEPKPAKHPTHPYSHGHIASPQSIETPL